MSLFSCELHQPTFNVKAIVKTVCVYSIYSINYFKAILFDKIKSKTELKTNKKKLETETEIKPNKKVTYFSSNLHSISTSTSIREH